MMKKLINILVVFTFLFLNVSVCFAEKFIYDSKGKRSPFSPPGFVPDADSNIGDISSLSMEIKGIIWDDNEPWAIINDKIVKKGDTISGALVHAMTKNEVTLKIKDKIYVLKIQERKAIK